MKPKVTINSVVYVPKNQPAASHDGLEYKIVRTDKAGVFAGYVESRNGAEIEMVNVRRLWYWDGAASLSQLAMEGVSKPDNCKFPIEVDRMTILGVIEILNCTQQAQNSIKGVEIWKR